MFTTKHRGIDLELTLIFTLGNDKHRRGLNDDNANSKYRCIYSNGFFIFV